METNAILKDMVIFIFRRFRYLIDVFYMIQNKENKRIDNAIIIMIISISYDNNSLNINLQSQ